MIHTKIKQTRGLGGVKGRGCIFIWGVPRILTGKVKESMVEQSKYLKKKIPRRQRSKGKRQEDAHQAQGTKGQLESSERG